MFVFKCSQAADRVNTDHRLAQRPHLMLHYTLRI